MVFPFGWKLSYYLHLKITSLFQNWGNFNVLSQATCSPHNTSVPLIILRLICSPFFLNYSCNTSCRWSCSGVLFKFCVPVRSRSNITTLSNKIKKYYENLIYNTSLLKNAGNFKTFTIRKLSKKIHNLWNSNIVFKFTNQ